MPTPVAIVFEQKDAEIFNIPDVKTRLDTLQNYFLPRLEVLLESTISLIHDIYRIDPMESVNVRMTPRHRKKDVKKHVDLQIVRLGFGSGAGRRVLKSTTGGYIRLYFSVLPRGSMRVDLTLCPREDEEYSRQLNGILKRNQKSISSILSINHVRQNFSTSFLGFLESFNKYYGQRLYSPEYFFPLHLNRGLHELRLAFASLYPLLDAAIRVCHGDAPRLGELFERYKMWLRAKLRDLEEIDDEPCYDQDADSLHGLRKVMDAGPLAPPVSPVRDGSHLPPLNNYTTLRPSLRWEILARDRWTCRSCGRTPRSDGVTLEVDHIVPRSKGGSNAKSNLQVLCKICNLGKSNRDNTNLVDLL